MSNSAYTINYFLRSHKRDPFIEFIKSLVHTPFAIHAQPITSSHIIDKFLSDTPQTPAEIRKDERTEDKVTLLLRDKYAEVMANIEWMIEEHRQCQEKVPHESRLKSLVPSLGKFFTPLPLRESFLIEDSKVGISARRHIPMSFNDIRKILNRAQVLAISENLRLITFDGDMTLYADGANFEQDSRLVALLIALLNHPGLHVAVVTAAGYKEASKYQARLSGLLKGFENAKLSKDIVQKFWVMGGECNFLFNCTSCYTLTAVTLVHNSFCPSNMDLSNSFETLTPITDPLPLTTSYIPPAYNSPPLNPSGNPYIQLAFHPFNTTDNPTSPSSIPSSSTSSTKDIYTPAEVSSLLDLAEKVLHECRYRLNLPAKIIRKERAVGIIPDTSFNLSDETSAQMTREQLDEVVLTAQHALSLYQNYISTGGNTDEVKYLKPPLPFCAFNGGSDVWVDIGNKLIGVKIFQEFLRVKGDESLHVGDQFLSTGNDYAARRACATIWITSPDETAEILEELVELLSKNSGASTITG